MSKITLHLIGAAPSWVAEFVNVARPGAIKGLNLCPIYTGVEPIVRLCVDQNKEPEPVSSYVRRGAAGGEELFWIMWPEIQKLPSGALIEPYNEVPIWDSSVLNGFAAFNQQLIKGFHEKGKRIMVGAINTNWPHPDQYRAVANACQGADGLSLHEYSPYTHMSNSGDVLKYRQFHIWCASNGISHPPIYITECGLDKPGGPDHGHWSWRTILNGDEEAYASTLAWYESELQKDTYVKAATVFTTGGGWPEFEFGQSVAMNLARKVQGSPVPEPPTPPVPPEPTGDYVLGVDVSKWQTDIDANVVWNYGARFVIIRLGEGVTKDPYFERYWQAFGSKGFLRGVYHVLQPNVDNQAAFIRDTLAGRKPEMGLWGDYEVDGLTAARIERYVTYVEQVAGIKPDTYSSPRLLNLWSPLSSNVTSTDLWDASPHVETPVMPNAWKTWKLWQFGQRTIDGRTVDVDYYNGTEAQLRAEYSNKEEPVVEGVTYQWYAGDYKKRDNPSLPVTEAEFEKEFGPIPITSGGEYHVAKLTAMTGPTTFRFGVFDASGKPVPNVRVVFYWPDAQAQPGAGYLEKGDIGYTKETGFAEFGMGRGAYYYPKNGQQGPHKAWIWGEGSDLVENIGMLGETEHDHYDVEVRLGTVEPEPPTPPTPPTTMYTLKVLIVGQGVVSVSPLQTEYAAGTVVTLKAIPAAGWEFQDFTSDIGYVYEDNPLASTMGRSKILTAMFVKGEEPQPPDELEALILAAMADVADAQDSLNSAEAKLILALALVPRDHTS